MGKGVNDLPRRGKNRTMTLSIDERTCQNMRESLRQEWLETNGMGGYASGTITGCHTRKYHGLLVANLAEPAGRYLLLSKFEDSIVTDDQEFALACHRYPGVFHPHGHRYLNAFSLEGCPVFRYRIGDTVIHKSIAMVHGENTVLVRYRVEHNAFPVTLRLKPLLAFRGHHELKHEDGVIRTRTDAVEHGFRIHPYDGLPPLFLQTSRPSTFSPVPDWYRRFEYMVEAERGYDHHEDLFCPGVMEVSLQHGQSVVVSAALTLQTGHSEQAWDREMVRRHTTRQFDHETAKRHGNARLTPLLFPLIQTARRFVIRTPTPDRRPTILAGYPWFDDWGRDTLISLPGLTFCSGNPEVGIAILKSMGPHERNGLIPNFFAANPAHNAYNSVDASLWYFWAVQQMLAWTGDRETVRLHFWPVMQRILEQFMAGTSNDIFMDRNGLLHAGNHATQLTWMDAQAYGKPVTPRHGCAVEINALWYNALCFTAQLARDFEENLPWPDDLTTRVKTAFSKLFWMESENCLADAFANGILDTSIRPNQILAASLPFSPLDGHQRIGVVERVRKDLLTPFGLRTLSPRDPAYCGRYEGDQEHRDAAYHQGTVWPWLLGHFGEAYLRVTMDRQQAVRFLLKEIQPLLDYSLKGPGLFNVPEIFDGDPPHRPNGCPAQAWSTAELIRLFTLCSRGLPE